MACNSQVYHEGVLCTRTDENNSVITFKEGSCRNCVAVDWAGPWHWAGGWPVRPCCTPITATLLPEMCCRFVKSYKCSPICRLPLCERLSFLTDVVGAAFCSSSCRASLSGAGGDAHVGISLINFVRDARECTCRRVGLAQQMYTDLKITRLSRAHVYSAGQWL